jgi:hypothetical protein
VPGPSLSIAPNGFVAASFVHVIVFVPSVVVLPSTSVAIAVILNVPFPRFGRKLVSIR